MELDLGIDYLELILMAVYLLYAWGVTTSGAVYFMLLLLVFLVQLIDFIATGDRLFDLAILILLSVPLLAYFHLLYNAYWVVDYAIVLQGIDVVVTELRQG